MKAGFNILLDGRSNLKMPTGVFHVHGHPPDFRSSGLRTRLQVQSTPFFRRGECPLVLLPVATSRRRVPRPCRGLCDRAGVFVFGRGLYFLLWRLKAPARIASSICSSVTGGPLHRNLPSKSLAERLQATISYCRSEIFTNSTRSPAFSFNSARTEAGIVIRPFVVSFAEAIRLLSAAMVTT